MAFVRFTEQAASLGRLPKVCMCCGEPAHHLVHHRFYYDPAWLMAFSLVFPRLGRLVSGYNAVELPVPLCGSHRNRFRLTTYLAIALALTALVAAPLLVFLNQTKQETALGFVAVLVALLAVGVLIAMFAIRISSPRLVEINGSYLGFTGVAPEFAGPMGSRAPSQPVDKTKILIGVGIAGGCLALLIAAGITLSLVISYTEQQQSAQFHAEAKQRHDEFVAKAKADELKFREEAERMAKMTPQERHEYFQKKAMEAHQATMPPGSPTAPPLATIPMPPPATTAQTPPQNTTPPSPPSSATELTPAAPPPNSVKNASPPAFASGSMGKQRIPVRATDFRTQGKVFPPNAVAVPPGTSLARGTEVWVLWGGMWHPGSIVQSSATGAMIHYDNYSASFDESKTWEELAIDSAILAALNSAPVPATANPSPSDSNEGELREWVDATGKFRIEARLVHVAGGKVKLKKANGDELVIAVEKLSREDQQYLQQR